MTEKRFTYYNTRGWTRDGFLNVMNGLDDKNKQLKEEILDLKKEIGRLNRKKYMEKPYWQKDDNNVCFEHGVEDVMRY